MIRKALMFIENDPKGGVIYTIDVIEHQGALWLVPYWLDNPAERWRTPERIIRMDAFAHQPIPNDPDAQFCLNVPIPRSWLYDPALPAEAPPGVVIFQPDDISLPLLNPLN